MNFGSNAMHIKKINIENFRLLKNFNIDLEDELSLVIGKNNTGKTSLLSVLDKFLNQSDKNRFSIDDFNLDFRNELKDLIEAGIGDEDTYTSKGVRLKIYIEYAETDDLTNISKFMMDLDPGNNTVVLGFEYIITFAEITRLRNNYLEFLTKNLETKVDGKVKDLLYFLNQNHDEYFSFHRKSIKFDMATGIADETISLDLDKEKISLKELISFKYISARREVTNKEIDKTLSSQTSKIYKKTESSDTQQAAIEQFKDQLYSTDSVLSGIYTDMFSNVVEKVNKFGGIKKDDSIIKIVSTLQHRELLDGNTTVMYDQNGHDLPEHYNGLGYMNLISMIFEVEILMKEFKKSKYERPADVNLLFIEEPEAHTHPQMQYVFIKNIKALLKDGLKREDGLEISLQYIISTHSSHIVSESHFNDIKYLKKGKDHSVISKNLQALEKEYTENGEDQNYRFLKQYLTLNRSELFFADKAVLVEGDTERILIPAMMKKLDQACPENPLLSQNISIVEVGAHSQIFEKFIDFVGVKTLVVTDIDTYYEEVKLEADGKTPQTYKNGNEKIELHKCSANDPKAKHTSNNSLLYFHSKNKIDGISYFIDLPLENKILCKNDAVWSPDADGLLFIAYQTPEMDYHARSFEDAFFHINKVFFTDEANFFNSLTDKWLNQYKDDEIDVFNFSENGVSSKPSLAIEILINSKTDANDNNYSNWTIPHYIKEGLEWLKKD